jgi:transposase
MKSDARKLGHKELTGLRRRAVSAVQDGEDPATVAKVLGVTKQAVYNWLSLYRQGGWNMLDARKRGGRRRKLDAAAMQWVYELVTGGDPRQLKLPFALWTGPLIAAAIKQHLGVKLSRWSVTRLLGQLGLSPQRPLHRAYQQNPQLVEEWKVPPRSDHRKSLAFRRLCHLNASEESLAAIFAPLFRG